MAAGLGLPRDHALISLLALNGLRESEAIGERAEVPVFLARNSGGWTPISTATSKPGKAIKIGPAGPAWATDLIRGHS